MSRHIIQLTAPEVLRVQEVQSLADSAVTEGLAKTSGSVVNKVIADAIQTQLADVDTPPTDLKISTASKGGVFNGGFELGTGAAARTTSGWIEDEKYGWYAVSWTTAWAASFDATISHSGSKSLKLSTTDATGKTYIFNFSSVITAADMTKSLPRIKPNTLYKLSAWVKTNNAAANAVYFASIQYDSSAVIGTTTDSSKLTGTNDWTLITTTLTSDADAEFLAIQLIYGVDGNVADAWFDDIKLEEVVTNTTFLGKVAEKIRQVLQAVTSTDNIDTSLDTAGAYANTYAITNAVNEGATHIQTFTPTKKYTTQIGVWPVAKGTGNWTLVVHTAGNVVVASKQIVNASVAEGAMLYFDVPNIWASGALHFHVYSSVADGTAKTNTTDDLEAASYIQRYAKKSESFSLIANGIKTELKSDKDGLLSNAIIDLDNGKYRWDTGILTTNSNIYNLINSTMNITVGGASDLAIANTNGWQYYSATYPILQSAAGAVLRNLVLKVTTILPIKHLKFNTAYSCGGATEATFQISADNTNWTTLLAQSIASADPSFVQLETDLMNGLSVFYIKLNKAASVDDNFHIGRQKIEADLDTSSIPQGLLYPIGTNQFTETVKLPSVATRVYYRLNKFTNENGVVCPALEFTDASAVSIGYVPLKLDNSQETSPSVAIVKASTTNGQASGTGSDEGNNYILNDGEFMTLSSAIAELSVVYLVGKGTTAFTNITKNTLYLSSNGESDDATQDPSHQGNFIVGARQQGLTDRVKDIGNQLEDVRNGIVKTSKWTDWTPTLTWTTGTPEGSVVTKARYKIVDKICYFTFYYSATDANAATALTISLPVLPKDNDTLTALSAQELADTTWSNPIAYIDDGGTTIVFRSFATIADTKAVKVLVSGNYEI